MRISHPLVDRDVGVAEVPELPTDLLLELWTSERTPMDWQAPVLVELAARIDGREIASRSGECARPGATGSADPGRAPIREARS